MASSGASTCTSALGSDGCGWVAILSSTLAGPRGRELVVWVRDRVVTPPAELADCPLYTLAELEDLVDADVTPDDLRALHAAKRIFPDAELDFPALVRSARAVGAVAAPAPPPTAAAYGPERW